MNLGFIKLPLYGLCIVTGILSGGFLAWKLCLRLGKNFYDFIIISAVVTAFGFLFAKLLYLLTAFSFSRFFYVLWLMLRHPVKSGLIESGFVFYGGLLGAIPGYFLGVKIARCSFRNFLNIFAFVVPYIHAWGRLGCFCAGCCYGIHYEGPFAIHYTAPLSDVDCGVGIFPVQLLEALFLLLFALTIFVLMYRKKIKDNSFSLILIYALLYSAFRFGIEFFRGDKQRGFVGVLSVSQFISILLFTGTALFMIILFIKNIKLQNQSEAKITE